MKVSAMAVTEVRLPPSAAANNIDGMLVWTPQHEWHSLSSS